jgi:hypothetical protein
MSMESESQPYQEDGEEHGKVGVTNPDGTFEKVDPTTIKKQRNEDWREQK